MEGGFVVNDYLEVDALLDSVNSFSLGRRTPAADACADFLLAEVTWIVDE